MINLSLTLCASVLMAQAWAEVPTVEPSWIGGSDQFRKKRPQRIISLAPSATEFVYALGAGPRVVGVSRYADFPKEVEKVDRVGGFIDPNVEKIIELRPDLVIAVTNEAVMPVLVRLAKMKIPVLAVPGNSLADTFSAGRAIADALGPDEVKMASRLLGDLKTNMKQYAASFKGKQKLKLAFVYGYDPLVLAGPGSFAAEIIKLLNAENIVKIKKNYAVYSYEQILIDRPDIILDGVPTDHGGSIKQFDWSKWKSIPAVKNKRVHKLDAMSVLRAGPRIFEAMKLVGSYLK